GSKGYSWAKTQENKCFQFLNDNTTSSSVPTLENNLAGDFSPALLTDPDNKMKQQGKMKRRLNARTEYTKFLEDTVIEMAKEVRIANDEILRFGKLFNDQLTLYNISRATLVSLLVDTVGATSLSFEDYVSKRQQKLKKEEEEKKKKHSVKNNKDVSLEETINATAAYAQEQLCKVTRDGGRVRDDWVWGEGRRAREEGGRFRGSGVMGQLGRGRGRRAAGSGRLGQVRWRGRSGACREGLAWGRGERGERGQRGGKGRQVWGWRRGGTVG
nr:hypothetical protein [Tanacetum cinerariifolium]